MASVHSNLTYMYYHKQSSDHVYLVLHGGGLAGIESPFISDVIQTLVKTGQSVFGLNFPYCERGDETTSGTELLEEVESIRQAVLLLQERGYDVTIVAKSLGAIAASFYLDQYPDEDIKLIVLGYVIGDVKTKAIKNNLKLVIQGEYDRFGGMDALANELSDVACAVSIIKNADHSYRNDKSLPVYQEAALAALINHVEETR